MKASWRLSRRWFRCPSVMRLSVMWRRRMASSTASSSADSCMVLSALATSETSSLVLTVIGSMVGQATSSPSGVSRMS
jgi:hypothetical protein